MQLRQGTGPSCANAILRNYKAYGEALRPPIMRHVTTQLTEGRLTMKDRLCVGVRWADLRGQITEAGNYRLPLPRKRPTPSRVEADRDHSRHRAEGKDGSAKGVACRRRSSRPAHRRWRSRASSDVRRPSRNPISSGSAACGGEEAEIAWSCAAVKSAVAGAASARAAVVNAKKNLAAELTTAPPGCS